MKLETVPDLFFVIAVFVPGFIYTGVLSQFVPLRQNKEKELIFLRLLIATAVNYALCSPLIYLLYTSGLFLGTPFLQAISWFIIILLVPTILGLLRAASVQKDVFAPVFKRLRLRPINPIPTGWDWIFSRTEPCYVLITLTNETQIAGYFGPMSMASSDPDRKDIYIEKLYKVPDDGGDWTEFPGTLGIQVDGAQISSIEFRE